MNKTKLVVSLIGVCSMMLIGGCTTVDPYTGESKVSKTAIGSGAGALGGAVIGQIAGGNTASTLIGAGIGAVAGGAIGNNMDRQDAELRNYLQSTVVQVVRLNNGDIRLIMPGDITFDHDRSEIKSNFYATLNAIVMVLKKFDDTTIKVAGYTSSVGEAMYNQELSEKRARSVADYLVTHGVSGSRVMAVGYGARYPVATNATKDGQELNRRVEITIHRLAK